MGEELQLDIKELYALLCPKCQKKVEAKVMAKVQQKIAQEVLGKK